MPEKKKATSKPSPFAQLAQAVVQNLGLQPTPLPRFAIDERVTAPVPRAGTPWPANMTEIVLGSATAPPTGTHIQSPRTGQNPFGITFPVGMQPDDWAQLPAPAQQAWAETIRSYPHVAPYARVVPRSGDDPNSEASVNTGMQTFPTISVNPSVLQNPTGELPGVLAHELTHIAQLLNYRGTGKDPGPYLRDLPHERRHQEQQAAAVESEQGATPRAVKDYLRETYGLARGSFPFLSLMPTIAEAADERRKKTRKKK